MKLISVVFENLFRDISYALRQLSRAPVLPHVWPVSSLHGAPSESILYPPCVKSNDHPAKLEDRPVKLVLSGEESYICPLTAILSAMRRRPSHSIKPL